MKKISLMQIIASSAFFLAGVTVFLFYVSFGIIDSVMDGNWIGVFDSLIKHHGGIYISVVSYLLLSVILIIGKTEIAKYLFGILALLGIYGMFLKDVSLLPLIAFCILNITMVIFLIKLSHSRFFCSLFCLLQIVLLCTHCFDYVLQKDYLSCFVWIMVDAILLIAYLGCSFCAINVKNDKSDYENDGYIHIVIHCLLMLFTVGAWNFFWIYRTTKYLNKVSDEPKQTPILEFFLCMIPFYPIYWGNRISRKIDKLSRERNINIEISLLCTVLMMIVIFLPPLIMQYSLNKIVKDK